MAGVEDTTRQMGASLAWARANLVERLRLRRSELDSAVLARLREALVDLNEDSALGLLADADDAAAACVEYGLASLERDEEWTGPIPLVAVDQARRAAHAEISLTAALACHIIGYAKLWESLIDVTGHSDFLGVRTGLLQGALTSQTSLTLRVVTSMIDEYVKETQQAQRSQEQRRKDLIRRILSGMAVDASDLDYELDAQHVGLIGVGPGASKAVQSLATRVDCRLLSTLRSDGTVWAWLGSRRTLPASDIARHLSGEGLSGVSVAMGEPAPGRDGFCLTHRQAEAALGVARHRPQTLTRYSDVALLASALRDDALARSLVEIYLSPLGDHGNGGASLRQTLRAYFATGRNASAAAATLGVERRTITNRLRKIEQLLGPRLHTRQAELEVALRLEELQELTPGTDRPLSGS